MTTAGLGGFDPGMVKSANSITAVTSISSSPVCFAAANSSKLPIPSCQMSWDSFSFFYQAPEPDHATGDSLLTCPAHDLFDSHSQLPHSGFSFHAELALKESARHLSL